MTTVLPETGSAFPKQVADLVPMARVLVDQSGTLPSRNQLMREFKIGRDKARAILQILSELNAPEIPDPVAPIPDPWDFAEPTPDPEPPAAEPVQELAPLVAVSVAPEPAPEVTHTVGTPAKPAKVKIQGRFLAWLALLVGLAASVAANVAYARPDLGPRLSSATAPVLVVLAAGLLERVPLGDIKWWRRWLAYGGLGVVVAAAFVTSFEHQYKLLLQYGNPQLSAVLLPIAVDGLIVLASVCLTVIAERRRVAIS